MRLYHFKLTKTQLDTIPPDERVLIVLLAHAANEISVLTKLFHFASVESTEVPLLVEARNAQALVLGRVLTGKIYECWNLMQNAFFSTKISQKLVPLFDNEARAAIDSLKHYFSRDNLIARVRNEFAFHYSPQQIAAGYETLRPDDAMDVYLSETNANTLYVFAESIAGRSLFQSINPSDHAAAFSCMISETSKAVGWLNLFIGACMSTSLRLHIGADLEALGAQNIDLEGAPDWNDINIPYFIEISDDADS